MTREEAIEELKEINFNSIYEKTILATNMAIDALKAMPCEDAISRQAALDALEWKWAGKAAFDAIKKLPSVNPQPKIGHWIDEFGGCECSECGCLEGGYSDYCPNCGAKMVESPESEDV